MPFHPFGRYSTPMALIGLAVVSLVFVGRSFGHSQPSSERLVADRSEATDRPVYIGIIARDHRCIGLSAYVVQAAARLLRANSTFRDLPTRTDLTVADDRVRATTIALLDLLDQRHAWFIAVTSGGALRTAAMIPDRPADQVTFWERVHATLEGEGS